MLNIWDEQIKNESQISQIELTPIIPIIFYHGRTKWNKKAFAEHFPVQPNSSLVNFLPKFDYHLIDMSGYRNEEITKQFSRFKLKSGLLLMKNIFDKIALLNVLTLIYEKNNIFVITENEQDFFQNINHYIFYSTNKNLRNQIIEIMKTLQTQQSQKFVSMADGLMQDGFLLGIEKGIEKGMEKGMEKEKESIAINLIVQGFNNETISKATGLSVEKIEKIRQQITEQ